jgi:alginate production protein
MGIQRIVSGLGLAFALLHGSFANAQLPEEQTLRERLTEREDQNRIDNPWSALIFGHTLTASGQYEVNLQPVHSQGLGNPRNFDGLWFENELEVEVFYSLGKPLSFFAQFRAALERDLWSQVPNQVSDEYFERGEMWIVSEKIAGTGFGLEIGRLDFEDDRRFWWDEDLDAIRVLYETKTMEVVFSVAREVAPIRSDDDRIDPDHHRVLRLFGEASWDWSKEHGVEAFVLHMADHSPTERVGEIVSINREDDSDATLTWFGGRASGAFEGEAFGIVGYWFDAAFVIGREKLLFFDDISDHKSFVEDRANRDVSGWAIDVGSTWVAPLAWEPRVTVGYAYASGERNPESGADRSFRQTGLDSNEPGFGGVQSFKRFGTLLDPELSNLHVVTVGLGVSLLESSSLDIVYHYYRQDEPTTELRDGFLEPELTGRHRELGHGIDIVLELEEWYRVEAELIGAFFYSGKAFATNRGEWAAGAFAKISIAF